MNWLEDKLNNPEFDEVYVGYTSFTRKKITTSNSGIWMGYRQGKPFFELRFRYAFPKGKFGQDVWTHFKACSILFDTIWPFTSRPPLVLVSSQRAINFIKEAGFKWLSIDQQEKAKMYFWLDTLTPTFEWYNSLEPPFCVLREMMLKESKHIAIKIGNKDLYDYSSWNDPD